MQCTHVGVVQLVEHDGGVLEGVGDVGGGKFVGAKIQVAGMAQIDT